MVRELGKGDVECECNSCLAVNEYKKTEVTNKTVKCKSCKNEGVNIEEHKGSIVNNLYIIRDQKDGRKAAAYCTICGRVSLHEIGTIIDETAECICSTEQTKMVCRFCGKMTFIINPKTGEAKCEDRRCLSAAYVRGIQGEIDIQKKLGLYHIIYKEEYGKNVDRLQYEIINDADRQPTLIVYKNIIYVGTNERKFFKAFCLRHQKHLILQEEEIEDGYDHTMCSLEYDLNIDEY